MQALVWILRLFIVAILIWFALKNSQQVEVFGFPGQVWQAPLVFVLLVAFVAGVVIGLLAWIPTVVRQRRGLGGLRRAAGQQAALASLASSPERGPAGSEIPGNCVLGACRAGRHGGNRSQPRRAPPAARHLHPGEGLGEGDRGGEEARGERQAQLPARDRELLLRACHRRAHARPRRRSAGVPRAGARGEPQM